MEVKTYQAIASRGDRYWVVHILGLGNNPDVGLPTQARTLAEVEPMVRDLIALWLEVPEDSFSINVQVHLPESVQKHLQHANELRTAADAARSEAAAEYRAAARDLKAHGLTVRDIGKALDVSHQRAQQLISR